MFPMCSRLLRVQNNVRVTSILRSQNRRCLPSLLAPIRVFKHPLQHVLRVEYAIIYTLRVVKELLTGMLRRLRVPSRQGFNGKRSLDNHQ